MQRSHVTALLLLLLAGHLLFGIGRIPHGVFGKRQTEAAFYHRVGRGRYLLEARDYQGWHAVEWLLRNTPEKSVILWRGEAKGSFELVADLVFPRLLYDASRVRPGTDTVLGLPIASKVLVGLGGDLELVPR